MSRAHLFIGLLVFGLMAGCIGTDDGPSDADPGANEASVYADLAELPATITGLELLTPSEVPTGSGIWVDGDHAYIGARGDGFYIADISNLSAGPQILAHMEGNANDPDNGLYVRDVDLITYEDGRKVTVLAGQASGMYFVDVTNASSPVLLSVIANDDLAYTYDGEERAMPTHNVAVVPNSTFVFNSPSGGIGRSNHLVDASDPEEPLVLQHVGEHGCHDITFFVDEEQDKHRAYCAGRDVTEIWDISNLTDVEILTQLQHPVVDNGGGLHHLAMVNQDASVLIIGDEFRGGTGPGCQAHKDGKSTPLGALWFFDITGEKELAPEELGSFSPTAPYETTLAANEDYPTKVADALAAGATPPTPDTSCTSHFGAFISDTPILAMGWYHAGVVLIDLSDPSDPVQVGQFSTGTNTWDVKFHRGVLVTGDMARGMDILKLI